MEFSSEITIAVGQLIAVISWVTWLIRKNTARLDKLSVDVAIIKSITESAKEDHDNLIRLDQQIHKLNADVHIAHEKIRALQ